jgi:hypothetical protein
MLSALSSLVQRVLFMIGAVYLILTVAVAVVVGILIILLGRMGVEFFRFRGTRRLLCPATGKTTVVRIDAIHAAVSGLLADPKLRVSDCSLWPERRACHQDCLRGIELH